MVYNKSKNPKLQYLHIMYVSVHSSVNGIILTLNNYIKAYKLQIYFFLFKKKNQNICRAYKIYCILNYMHSIYTKI